MANAFQSQFLKLGLVDKKQVAETKSKKRKQQKSTKVAKGKPTTAEENLRIQREADEKKKERVRKLNLERDEKLRKRASAATVKQMIQQNRLKKDDKGLAFRFNMEGKIYRVFVDKETSDKLGRGVLGIVRMPGSGEVFEVLPRAILEKIRSLDSSIFIHLARAQEETADADDPYADFQVPDDLMW
jgi:uncharacterized protein YaiL (DUF2058 family)